MTNELAKEIGGLVLARFLDDLRRALQMHRKVSLGIIFRLCFPDTDRPLYDGSEEPANMDIQQWLADSLPDKIRSSRLFSRLIAEQDRLIQAAAACQDDVRLGALQVDSFARFLRELQVFEQVADRFMASITTAMSDVDELTGLLNRTAMERDLDREQAQGLRTGRSFTIAMVDADHFKKVNDDYGHDFGDKVLEVLAERFIDSLRPQDRVYRYGGEEFLILLPDTSLDKARAVLERLRRVVCENEISDSHSAVSQSVSIGATELKINEDIEKAIARADQALYRAKEAGRNRVEVDEHLQSSGHPK